MTQGRLDHMLLDANRYREVFARLKNRARAEPHRLSSAPVERAFSLQWILQQEDQVIQEILRSLKSGNLELSPSRLTTIITNKKREIFVNHWVDRIVLMVVAQILLEQFEPLFSHDLYSFRRGRSNQQALRELKKFLQTSRSHSILIVKRDISRYGDSIPQGRLWRRLSKTIDLRGNVLFASILRQGIRPKVQSQDRLWTLTQGIPSGSPLIPPLENFYLLSLDRRFDQLRQQMAPLFYARYGDDFLIATPHASYEKIIDSAINQAVSDLGLSIKDEKKVNLILKRHQSPGFEWLGRRINPDFQFGLKTQQYREVKKFLSAELRHLARLATPYVSQRIDVAITILHNGTHDLFIEGLMQNERLRDFVVRQEKAVLVKSMDQWIRQILVCSLCKQGLKRRLAWRLIRKAKIPSIQFLRHMIRRGKSVRTLSKLEFKPSAIPHRNHQYAIRSAA